MKLLNYGVFRYNNNNKDQKELKLADPIREDDNVFPEVPWSIITLLANTLADSSSLLLVSYID